MTNRRPVQKIAIAPPRGAEAGVEVVGHAVTLRMAIVAGRCAFTPRTQAESGRSTEVSKWTTWRSA
jgi:hypothetical protein